ncbi:hypothetical protein DL546_006096 [Coniochaeta pulveracea]|uniref:Uncharacterized protein n=1 Tax=Coniochaeta pulveracea TaxID=177199 RepID=A0A420YCT5_9PEZI|nr:hypothetical protein DL546_006096 [Coniochaeta pulveracea]
MNGINKKISLLAALGHSQGMTEVRSGGGLLALRRRQSVQAYRGVVHLISHLCITLERCHAVALTRLWKSYFLSASAEWRLWWSSRAITHHLGARHDLARRPGPHSAFPVVAVRLASPH